MPKYVLKQCSVQADKQSRANQDIKGKKINLFSYVEIRHCRLNSVHIIPVLLTLSAILQR